MAGPSCGRSALAVDRLVQQLLREMADKLDRVRPGGSITTIGRHALLQATTMDPPLLRALRAHAPEITGSLIRRAYAAQLRQAAEDMGDLREDAPVSDDGRVPARVLLARAATDYTRAQDRRDQLSREDRVHGQEPGA
ncbi:hypothetical protein [Streptomyces sp. PAM3C]|uniref:hypothetical protein n=1 Tax=Streptomyces sp. PAM3C TaxID=2847300 RepID=UPI001C1DD4C3|nr:hypothetical protein [Streptomyces sp. PAM3C]MBU5946780.1 hypothetical protein [Streptomyces sp. PAM3C]